jgi:GT2 family glycosyltransferase
MKEFLTGADLSDERIVFTPVDDGTSMETKSGVMLSLAEGDFIILIGEQDVLAPNMLFEVEKLIEQNPDLDMIYIDEDRLDSRRRTRHKPWFKPDFSPELLLSINYIHPAVIRRELVDRVGGFAPNTYPVHYSDLILRCIEKTNKIGHISKILCHVRQHARTKFARSKWRWEIHQRHADIVAGHLERSDIQDVKGHVTSLGFIRLIWPSNSPSVSIIIPTHDNLVYLRRCLDSLFTVTDYENFGVVLVDNGSREQETLAYYETLYEDPRILFVPYDEPFNFSTANNSGAMKSKGELILFLNDDVKVIDSEWLEEMVRWVERPEIGVVGAKLLYPDRSIQHAGIILGMGGHAGHVFYGAREGETGPFGSTEWYRNYMAVTGACLMIPRKVFNEVGGFDESFRLAFGDVDLCLRVKNAGYRVLYTPFARLIHYEGATRGHYIPMEDMLQAYEAFAPYLRSGDPNFSPNLSYSKSYPVIATKQEEDRLARVVRILREGR